MHNEVFERARLARDARFDGHFFVGVRTTGIYCRPVCPAVAPRRENVEFFPSAAAAGEAGFRPCLRCRPECAPGTPAWAGTSTTVRRGLRLIDGGALDNDNVETLAGRLGVTSRHLRRLFTAHVGASPLAVAHTRRLHFAKRLIDDTALPMQHIATAAGYGSVRRFNDAFRKTYGRAPRDLRRLHGGNGRAPDDAALRLRLPYRAPFRFADLLAFHAARATPGVEAVSGDSYRRVLAVNGAECRLTVRAADDGFVSLTLHGVPAEHLFDVVQRTRDVFDLDAPTDDIRKTLSADPRLKRLLRRQPGVRVPGAWDGFELAVRAILGQQVSVRAATTLAGRLVACYGTPLAAPADGLTHRFPRPERLLRARFNNIGLVRARADTLRRLAAAVVTGDVHFDPLQDLDDFRRALTAIRGIGAWTAEYVMMRALKHPDALPAADLGLLKALDPDERVTPAALAACAEAWRPWRAYAAVLLWGDTGAGG
ncbi:MAG: Ada metal-binding domain-containing protein [Woeseiaceae bacterium]|nr:Ada metal-binding domain-containing protein [Woeseiaceae bacterium]